MNLHEFQAKALFRSAGIPVPPAELVTRIGDAREAWPRLESASALVKAQVHSGGRGKAGGVVHVTGPAEAEAAVARLLGTRLVTGQSGPEGLPVDQVLIEPAAAIAREFYFGMLVDRARESVAMVVSAEGGMDIETLAREKPEAVVTMQIHPVTGVMPFHGRRVAQVLGLTAEPARAVAKLVHWQSVGAALAGHQARTQQLFRRLARSIGGIRHDHATGLAATARVHLGLDQRALRTQRLPGSGELVRRGNDPASGNRDAGIAEACLGLKFVEIHGR